MRDAARRGKLKLALVAGDASKNSMDKVVPLLTARGVAMIEGLTSADLATVCGRESVSAIGVLDSGLASGIRAAAPDSVVNEDVARQKAVRNQGGRF